jgi:cyclic pyranopterin phosphate synthase
MPEEGLQWNSRNDLLSFEEIIRLLSILHGLGIRKVRFTGGEPFVRKDFMHLLRTVFKMKLFDEVTLTSNGVLLQPHLAELKELGIAGVNLSLDSLDEARFFQITRRPEFETVLSALHALMAAEIPTKINAVVMAGKNEADIAAFCAFTKDHNVAVRFIEEMPFNGGSSSASSFLETDNKPASSAAWHWKAILAEIQRHHPQLERLNDGPTSTSMNYRIANHAGSVGIIAAYSRTFCGTCNRLRITPKGALQTCLYAGEGLSLRDLLRTQSDSTVAQALKQAVSHRAKDGFEAAHTQPRTSMAEIGG